MSEKLHYSGVNMRNVKALADKRHVSLTDLAEKIGITYVGLSKIIRENTTTLGTLQRLADALGVPVQVFFMSEEEMEALADFSFQRYMDLKKENQRLLAEISDLKDKIIRLADKF